jgi:hypothetical protein
MYSSFALVNLVKESLKTATKKLRRDIDHVTELSELAELQTLFQSLHVITNLTVHHDDSKVGISSVGGVQAILKCMKTLPKCAALQVKACHVLLSLTCCSIGKKKALEAGGVAIILDAVNHHIGCASICEHACKIFLGW